MIYFMIIVNSMVGLITFIIYKKMLSGDVNINMSRHLGSMDLSLSLSMRDTYASRWKKY